MRTALAGGFLLLVVGLSVTVLGFLNTGWRTAPVPPLEVQDQVAVAPDSGKPSDPPEPPTPPETSKPAPEPPAEPIPPPLLAPLQEAPKPPVSVPPVKPSDPPSPQPAPAVPPEDLEPAKRYPVLDAHALKASPEVEESLEKLVGYLIQPCKTDREKVRAIYRWVTDRIAYDAATYFSGKRTLVSPAEVLRDRKAICQGYASLFEDLCKRAGVQVASISGHDKRPDHVPGQKTPLGNHAWSAVYFEGKWWLVDPTWGAGSILGKNFIKQFRELYFLTPPDTLILDHLPREDRWQLLDPPLTRQEFEDDFGVDRALLEYGVATQEIRAKLREKGFRGFVRTPSLMGARVSLLQAPLDQYLQAGNEYRFQFRSPDVMEMAVSLNGKFQPLKKEGNLFQGVVSPQKGTLKINCKLPGQGNSYFGMLNYIVE